LESNPFAGKKAIEYDNFFKTPFGRVVFELEKELLFLALEEFKGKELLEVGCGTGIWVKVLKDEGFEEPVGLDISLDMLKVARTKGLKKLLCGTGTELPFKDGSFSCTYFVTSLEFILDKRKALLEAARVSREKLVIAFLNKYSLLNLFRSLRGIFKETTYSRGSFLTKEEILRLARSVGESSPFSLKFESFYSTLNFSIDGFASRELERKLGFNLPFGAFGVIKFRVVRRDGAGKGNRV